MTTSTLAGALNVTRWLGGELSHCSLVSSEEVAAPLQEPAERGQVVEPLHLQLSGGIQIVLVAFVEECLGELMIQGLLHDALQILTILRRLPR